MAPTEFDFDEEEGPAEESFSYRRTPGKHHVKHINNNNDYHSFEIKER